MVAGHQKTPDKPGPLVIWKDVAIMVGEALQVGQSFTCGDIEQMLGGYVEARDDEQDGKKRKDRIGKMIREHIEACDQDRHYDGERELSAAVQTPSTTSYDLINMAEQHPELVLELAKRGLLTADKRAVEALTGKFRAVDVLVNGFTMKGQGTPRLRVEKKR